MEKPKKAKKHRSLKAQHAKWAWVFLAPWLIGIAVFFVWPMAQSVIYSFSRLSITASGFQCRYSNLVEPDTIVIADGNFPAETMGKDAIVIRADGHGVPEILDAILKVFPLDTYVEKPVNLMELMPGDVGKVATPIWDTYKEIIAKYDDRGADCVGNIDRFKFYDESKDVYCIIATSEKALYANVMLQKGVVVD